MQVVFHRLADAEAQRIARRLGRQGAAKRARFVAAVADAVTRIAANPLLGSPAFGAYRWVRVGRFKYLLYYGLRKPSVAEVFAVAHAGRRPGTGWGGRDGREDQSRPRSSLGRSVTWSAVTHLAFG